MAVHVTHLNLLNIKNRFQVNQNVRIKIRKIDVLGRRHDNYHHVSGKIIKLYDNFILIRTKNYYMTVPYRDILIGDVLIKEVSMC